MTVRDPVITAEPLNGNPAPVPPPLPEASAAKNDPLSICFNFISSAILI